MSVPTDNSVAIVRTRTNFRTWLSAARADLQTCLDAFEWAPDAIRKTIAVNLERSTQLVTTSLGIITKIDVYMRLHEEPLTRMSLNDRQTLQNVNQGMQPDAVVAADGSGDYLTINEAINAVPPRNNERFVIYVKKGVYLESVLVGMSKWNILMYGDGMHKTVVSGSRSNATGSTILQSATFAVQGFGFMAMDIGFENTAGPKKGQAVALFSASDRSVFYRCMMDGYQDTLFANSHRQFYRECDIYGTVDFIFGDAAMVIQNSNIYLKRGISNTNVITAQGKHIPQSISGISIHNCCILAAENLDGVETFLGRPWKNYSTVVIMESQLGSFINPRGWRAWEGSDPRLGVPDSILYVEYNNVGVGAVTTKRVHWKGLKVENTQEYARSYTVGSFLGGDDWLPSTGVAFEADLYSFCLNSEAYSF
ncbi:pectinesterase [Salvia divinorum]